ncbi:MAG: aspartate ammonia-lyase [Deltaproteobacteria bacterium]|nr:aspartate ammonia-lyase [Deltaproteobacteria bacterium]
MEKVALVEFVKKIELFKDLDPDSLAVIAQNLEEKRYESGEMLFSENNPREEIVFIKTGRVLLFKKTPHGEEKTMSFFGAYDFLGEGAIIDDTPHFASARVMEDTVVHYIKKENLIKIFESNGTIAMSVYSYVAKVISRRMRQANSRVLNTNGQFESGRSRTEHDLLGYRDVPHEYYYGIQTLRALENFNISGVTLKFFPVLIEAFASVKMAAAEANHELGILDGKIKQAIVQACDEIRNKRLHDHFVVDMIQGGAGTSTNMNANEVIANRAIEIMGHERGEYQYCHPNNHVNLSQSTNDAYPTAVKIALHNANATLLVILRRLINSFHLKAEAFSHIIKMGRTQLQDAVPMTLGQAFESYAATFEKEVLRLQENADLFLMVNMGATAIGTGINTDPGYSEKVIKHLKQVTGLNVVLAENLVEATQDTGAFVMYSSAIKRLSIKLSKICNDLRLLSSGPRTGLNEINLPKMQPGSSIMPGKVNPVIPEVVNQIAFKVIGNDLTVSLGAEAGQLELNVMEPVIVQSIFESIEMLKNGITVLIDKCINGITANEEHIRNMVLNSIGLVTALNPVLGYETSTQLAKEALEQGKGVYELVLEQKLMTREKLDEVLAPENMVKPRRMGI